MVTIRRPALMAAAAMAFALTACGGNAQNGMLPANAPANAPAGALAQAQSAQSPALKSVEGAAFEVLHRNGPMFVPTTVGGALSLCPGLVRPGTSNCMALLRVHPRGIKRLGDDPDLVTSPYPGSFAPVDLRNAYGLVAKAASAGIGQTVALVDAYDDPNAQSDLNVYRAYYGEPACTASNHCFSKVDQNGGTHYPPPNAGWAGEISLDLDMVSAICPNCHIILVEAADNANANLEKSVDEAVALGAHVVSNSYGGDESQPSDAAYAHAGVVITASAGDGGYYPEAPAAYPTVIAVGGTSLSKASGSRPWTETAWQDGGSGCSLFVPKPSWQSTQTICPTRAIADTAAVADPNTPVAVYDSYPGDGEPAGWQEVGGTSVSSPIIGSVFALAGNATRATPANSIWYWGPRGSYFNDIISGSNGACPPVWKYICNARVGYDGPTGWGTPKEVNPY